MNFKTVAIVVLVVFIIGAFVILSLPPGQSHTTSTLSFQEYQYPGMCIDSGPGWATATPGKC